MKTLFLILTFYACTSYSVEPMDNYYANDIIDAVNQAKARPHHYDYSSTYRYKRTTAQSIELNRLDLNELDETRLNMDGKGIVLDQNINASEIAAIQHDGISSKKTAQDIQTPALSIQHSLPSSSQYQSNYGLYSSQGVLSEGTVISTPRP